MNNGKHIVTANKAVLSKYIRELFQLACKNKVEIFFEAAIGGGIPIIKVLRESLSGNRISEIHCIINGTTNFILSKMIKEGASFKDALKKAKELGFAEADPTLDVNGNDAAHKTGLLALLAFNTEVNPNDIYFEGIENISEIDITAAKELGYKIKLLGIAKNLKGNSLELRVHPTFISTSHELSTVENEFNAVYIKSDFLGPSLYYGRGAGSKPTASAVVSDLNDLAHLVSRDYEFNSYRYTPFNKMKTSSIDDIDSKYFIRLYAKEKVGILAQLATIFAKNKISIESLVQKEEDFKDGYVPIWFITHTSKEKNIKKALLQIQKSKIVRKQPVFYRINDFNQ